LLADAENIFEENKPIARSDCYQEDGGAMALAQSLENTEAGWTQRKNKMTMDVPNVQGNYNWNEAPTSPTRACHIVPPALLDIRIIDKFVQAANVKIRTRCLAGPSGLAVISLQKGDSFWVTSTTGS
jgi:hypothetical protein